MRRSCLRAAIALLFLALVVPQSRAAEAEQILSQAAGQRQFTFVVFFRADDPATKAMTATLTNGLAKRQGIAAIAYVHVANPAEKAVVERFKVGRAPMPLTLAVAPNGAVTGIFSKQIADRNIDEALVSPTKAACLKALQEGKLVFVCIDAANGQAPAAVREYLADPEYQHRVAVAAMSSNDPAEAKFLPQLGVDPLKFAGPQTVFMAPPGTVVGKFAATATKAQLAAALHAAGKCCDDPNCKHAHGGQASPPSGAPAPRQTAQPTAPRRN